MAIQSINPTNGKLLDTFDEWSAEKTRQVLAEVREAWLRWRHMSLADRARAVKDVATVLRRDAEGCARIMALEMGKPVTEGRREVERSASVLEYFAEKTASLLAAESAATGESPLGIVLAAPHWNYPFLNVFRVAAPALMAGNAVVVTHSANVPFCALDIENVFRRAGFPEQLFRAVMIGAGEVPLLLQGDAINAVVVGASEAGLEVAAEAARLQKRSIADEPGGDCIIVLADAALDAAAKSAAEAASMNAGRNCTAARHIIVEKRVCGAFVKHLKHAVQHLVVGDPLEEETQVGPLAREDLLHSVHAQVIDAVEKGAELVLGGKHAQREGYFYPPTLLVGVGTGMRVLGEDLFGPITSVIPVQDVHEAIKAANAPRFRQAASVWTQAPGRGDEVAAQLDAGKVFVNTVSDSGHLTPSGVKHSRYIANRPAESGIRQFLTCD